MIKSFYIPFILFIAAFTADSLITSHGIAHGGGEGNVIVVWLWSIFGKDSILLKFIYLALVIAFSYLISKKYFWVGLWIIYSFAFGHVLGFSTWVTSLYLNTLELITFPMLISLVWVCLIREMYKRKKVSRKR